MKNPFTETDHKGKIFLVTMIVVIFMLYKHGIFLVIIYQNPKLDDGESSFDYCKNPANCLTNTSKCRMPNIYPFSTDIAIYIYRNPLAGKSDYKSKIFLVIVVVVFFTYEYSIFLSMMDTKFEENRDSPLNYYYHVPIKYLIDTPTCKIPDIDPFYKDTSDPICKVRHLQCRKLELLTYIEKRNETITLHVNTSVEHRYSKHKITCCYSKIIRNNESNVDNTIIYTPCSTFEKSTIIFYPYIRVTCSDPVREVYANVHAVTIPTRKQLETSTNRKGVFSMLLLGIGSMSKVHLKRTMPKTYSYLERHFISLKGYNNIGDNTYHNLMAILTGQNETQVKYRCGHGDKLKLQECGFIWEVFKNLGYVTAYAEDARTVGVFNCGKPGFVNPPTDYYYRPYMLAVEKLIGSYIRDTSPEESCERMLDIVKDVSVSFANVPKFGFAWMNSACHDDVNIPFTMDEKILNLLDDPSFKSSLKNTIMIFFSDHGLRHGNMKYAYSGWLEERLPMMYFYIPNSFKQDYPDKYYSLLINTQRLTTPYDVHNTMQEVLELANNVYVGKNSVGCPKCQSLFKQIDEFRTCKDAAIDLHWCTCTGHSFINPKDRIVQPISQFIIDEINSFITHSSDGDKCAKYNLEKVISASISDPYLNDKNRTMNYFVVIAQTYPSAIFEANVEAYLESTQHYYRLLGDISRLDEKSEYSDCVKNATLKKYCYCG